MRANKAQRRKEKRRKKKRLKLSHAAEADVLTERGVLEDKVQRAAARASSSLRQGTFYPELTLGAGALTPKRRLELEKFLVAVVCQRGCPLHLANLWNALYFNYDLGHWGFRLDHLEQERIPTRTARARDFSLPVGGFVRVHTEAACGDLLAEVIYKEGAHSRVDVGWLDPEVSGAPAIATAHIAGEAIAIVRERFVLDLEAFGPDANDMSSKQYKRLCQRALWLDRHGHLMMEAMYASDEANVEDLDYYADYLLKEHRYGLLAFCFNEELSDDQLREALLRSFDAVREIAAGAKELRSWRDKYFFRASVYDEQVSYDGPLGRDDMRGLFQGLVHVPADRRHCYSPIGPRILEMLERDGLDATEEALLQGSAYAAAVCHANAYIADALADEQPEGVLPGGMHLRLDDDWQGGGVWRSERVGNSHRYSLKAVPPLLPLGLGYAETHGALEAHEGSSLEEQPTSSSQTGFKIPLTLRDRALGRLRLSAAAAQALAPGLVEVVIKHGEKRVRSPVERDGANLYGVEYPWEFYPGIQLVCNVESGGSIVRARTVEITPPLIASDGQSLDFETNLGVYEREMGLKELTSNETRGAPTLTELIHRAFRLRGHHRDDGARAMTLGQIATVVLGPGWKAVETRPIAQALQVMALDREGADYLWRPRVTRRTRSSDRSLLTAYGEGRPQGRLERVVRRHWVPMHLRRYTQRSPSHEKRSTYAEARRRYGMHGVLPEELPPDCTWVEPYDWGGEDEVTMSQLELSEEASPGGPVEMSPG